MADKRTKHGRNATGHLKPVTPKHARCHQLTPGLGPLASCHTSRTWLPPAHAPPRALPEHAPRSHPLRRPLSYTHLVMVPARWSSTSAPKQCSMPPNSSVMSSTARWCSKNVMLGWLRAASSRARSISLHVQTGMEREGGGSGVSKRAVRCRYQGDPTAVAAKCLHRRAHAHPRPQHQTCPAPPLPFPATSAGFPPHTPPLPTHTATHLPVRSEACTMRRWLCPPSRVRCSEPSLLRVNSAPSSTSSSTRAGPSRHTTSTALRWHGAARWGGGETGVEAKWVGAQIWLGQITVSMQAAGPTFVLCGGWSLP